MTGKAQIVSSSFGGSSHLNALGGSRDTGQPRGLGVQDSMVGFTQVYQYQSVTSADQANYQATGGFQQQSRLNDNMTQDQRQFSAVQFRKNHNSVVNLGNVAEVNVRMAAQDSASQAAAQGIARGSSQQSFPSQALNFGAMKHGFTSDTQKGLTPASGLAVNTSNNANVVRS